MNATQDRTNNTFSDIPRQSSSPRHSLKFPITPTSSSSASLKSSTSSRASTSSGSSPLSSSTNQPEKSDRAPNGRPLSHHRRKSSVSTRRESQEIITGVLVGEDEELPASREEIRKRALLALEGGRNVMAGFTRVEIPEWKTPGAENKTFDWDPASLGNLGNLGMNPLAGKRDSFGRSLAHASMSSKAELGTLVEEEEDEDDDHTGRLSGPKKLDVPVTQIITPTPPHKARPASLMLRQLSLVGDLPTPATTPSPRHSSSNAMRPLTLSPSLFSTPPSNSSTNNSNSHRSSVSSTMSFTPASPASPSPLGNGASPAASAAARRQQSRLSYRRDSSGQSSPSSMDFHHSSPLQTQLRTPQSSISSSHLTHSSRLSQQSSIGGNGAERPMTPTEAFAQQTFNMQAHATLLDRIAILEEALAKAQAQSAPGPVEEELIALVADLKSSRDQLHERASTAEAQVGELERAAELARKRLEGARQDAWAARDRADLLQLQLDGSREELEVLGKDKARWEAARAEWKKERTELEARLESVMAERDAARAALEVANAKLALATSVPVVKQRATTNMSASSAATTMFGDSDPSNADEAFENFRLPLTPGAASFKFKDQGEPPLSVLAEEEDEDDTNHGVHAPAVETSKPEPEADPRLRASFAANFEDSYSDEEEDDNGLGEYEDEPTGFAAFMEATHSSNDELMDDFDDDNDDDLDDEDEDEDEDVEEPADEMIKPSEQHARAPSTTHNRRVSLVVNWRFPQGGAAPALNPKRLSAVMHANPFFITEEEVDFDDVPRAALVTTGNTPKKPTRKSQTRVEVTPELADSFAVNFVDEDDEGFSWGEPVPAAASTANKAVVVEQKPKTISKSPRSSDPLCPPADVMEKSLHKLASIVPLVPKEEDAKPAPAPAVTAAVPPPPMSSSKPKSRVMATGRPKVTPPPFIIPPPTFASASSPSPFTRATSPPPSSFKAPPSSFPSSAFLAASASSEASSSSSFSSSITSSSAPSEDNSFSYSFFSSGNGNTRARSGTLSPTGSAGSSALGTMHPNEDIENQYTPRNVVAFPTTSASPFTMRVLPASSLPSASSIGSTLASWVPSWGSSRASPAPAPATPTSPSKMTRAMSPSIASVFAEDLQRPASPASSSSHSVHTMQLPSTPKTRQQVSADVMRERLRARLMQEGKLKSPGPGSPGLSSSPSLRR